MSLGSRIAKRGRVAVFASLASTPREPLLFLYPSWIRNSSTASPAPRDAHAEPATQQTPVSIPKYAAALSEEQSALDKRFNGHKATSSDQQTLEPKSVLPKSRPPNITTEDGIASLQSEPSIAKDVKPKSVTEKTVRKVLSLQANNDNSKLSASSSRKAYQAYRRTEMQTWIPDWRAVLSTLVKSTPDHGKWLSKALEFKLSDEEARKLLYGIDDYFADIGEKYGCQMTLGARENCDLSVTSFIISGPATAISKCAAEILSIAPNVKITPFKESLSSPETFDALDGGDGLEIYDSRVRVRNVMVDDAQLRKPPMQVRPEDIKKPSEWTQQSLLDYVRALTTTRVRSHVNRYGFNMEDHHETLTANFLRDLFKDLDVRPAITRKACHQVMQYWIKGSHIEDARILFVHMEILKLQLVPETFNILLAGAAKCEDVHNFHFILHLMLNRGIMPNGRTWTHFMSTFKDVRIKLHILTAMQKKGLLNHPQTMIEATTQLVHPEIEASLDQNQTQEDFISHMDSRYGKTWVSNSSGNQIVHSLGAHGLISRCWEFLQFMDSRHVLPNSYAVHTILHHCKQAANLAGAIEVLRSLPPNMIFQASEETFRILFELAWRLRSYNVAKVVWRYACLYGATSFRMRQRVFLSMKKSNEVEKPTNSRRRWAKYAGPVIVGINHIKEHPSRFLERLFPEIELARFERKKSLQSDVNLKREPWWSKETETFEDNESLEDDQSNNTPHTQIENGRPAMQEWDDQAPLDDEVELVKQPSTPGTKVNEDVESKRHSNNESLSDAPIEPEPAIDPSPHLTTFTPIQLTTHRTSPSYLTHLAHKSLPPALSPWSPSTLGKRLPYYKTSILKDIMQADLEMFKQWEPVRAFEDMLVEALEMDAKWKKDEMYRNRELEWFLDGRACRVGVRTKTSRLMRVFEWR